MSWRLTTLGSCCEIVSGSTPSTSQPRYWDGDIEWATPKDLSELSSKYINTTTRRISREGLNSCGATLLPPRSVLFSSRAPIGHVAINTVPMATNQGFKSFVPNRGEVDEGFLYYWLRANRPFLEGLGNGATFKEVSKAVVSRVEIRVPSFLEQQRIADILDKADAIRRKRKEAIALTEALLRSTFLEMFGDPVTNPKGWPTAPLAELGLVVTGNTPPRERLEYYGSDIEWIKSDNINTDAHVLTRASESLSEVGRKVGRTAPAGSTLITCIAGSPDCIGNVGLADREVAFNQQINAVVPGELTDHRFLYGLLWVGKKLVQGASTNSMKGMVSKGRLESLVVPRPPKGKQTEFGKAFTQILAVEAHLREALAESEALFASLVDRAFRGELTAPATKTPSRTPKQLSLLDE